MRLKKFGDRLSGLIAKRKAEPLSRDVTEYQRELRFLQDRLQKVQNLFDIETDDSRIEALIYEEISVSMRIDSLIKSAKQKQISYTKLLR